MRLLVAAVGAFCVAASTASAAPLRSVYEVAQDIQTFYPVGSATSDDRGLDYYVMAANSGTTKPTLGAWLLINTSSGPGDHIQIVEIGSVTCATRTFKPSFRLVLNSKGQMLDSGGPVPDTGDGSGTLLTPSAVRLAADLLCDGIVPKNALENRSLADFR